MPKRRLGADQIVIERDNLRSCRARQGTARAMLHGIPSTPSPRLASPPRRRSTNLLTIVGDVQW